MPPALESATRPASLDDASAIRTRVWDLPTRVFHWALTVAVIGQIATGFGGVMEWHFRIGYTVLSLLLFRLIWGFVGGRWSRFAAFIYSPGSVMNYLRGRAHPDHLIGHTPLGAFSVFALLAILALQVATGLVADDEIMSSGPLTRFVSGATVSLATAWHTAQGKWIVIDERPDRRDERVVRVVHEDVARRQDVEDRAPRRRVGLVHRRLVRLDRRGEPRLRRRLPRRFLQLRTVERVDLPQRAVVEAAAVRVDVLFADLELLEEQLADVLRHAVGDLEPDDVRRPLAVPQTRARSLRGGPPLRPPRPRSRRCASRGTGTSRRLHPREQTRRAARR